MKGFEEETTKRLPDPPARGVAAWVRWAPASLAVAAVLIAVGAKDGPTAVAESVTEGSVTAESAPVSALAASIPEPIPTPGARGSTASTSVSGLSSASGDGAVPNAQQVVSDLDYEFYRDRVEPIFLRDRGGFGPGASACVACHVPSGTPLKLQPLQTGEDGQVFWTEDQSRRNFVVVSTLVSPGQPERSRLLREPLEESAGGSDFHVGGKFWESQDDPEWQTMAEWVRTADAEAPSGAADATMVPSFDFFRTCVQRIFLDREEEADRMECAACHGSGFRGFAQELPEGRDFWNEEESRENFNIVMRYIEPGFPLRSRFLTHPLDYHDGGDGYHSGGRRWMTQDDPEWQMLAEWVEGRTPACVVEDR